MPKHQVSPLHLGPRQESSEIGGRVDQAGHKNLSCHLPTKRTSAVCWSMARETTAPFDIEA